MGDKVIFMPPVCFLWKISNEHIQGRMNGLTAQLMARSIQAQIYTSMPANPRLALPQTSAATLKSGVMSFAPTWMSAHAFHLNDSHGL